MIAGMNFYTALVQVICLQIDGLGIPIRLKNIFYMRRVI